MIKSNAWLSARNLMLASLTVAATLGAATTAPARDDDEKDRGKHYGRSKNNNDERGEWRERQQRHEAWLREQERRERREALLLEQERRERREAWLREQERERRHTSWLQQQQDRQRDHRHTSWLQQQQERERREKHSDHGSSIWSWMK